MKRLGKSAAIRIARVLIAALLALLVVSLPLEADGITDDLIAKQSKLVEKWGVKQLDEVASRFDGFRPWQKEGWKKVNKLYRNAVELVII